MTEHEEVESFECLHSLPAESLLRCAVTDFMESRMDRCQIIKSWGITYRVKITASRTRIYVYL